jgi:predicted permease
MTFAEIGPVVTPVFGLIALGYGAAAAKLFTSELGEALGEFVFALPVPVLIFRTIAVAQFPDVSPWPLWIAYFCGVILSWGTATILARRVLGLSAAEGVIAGVSASFSNTVMIGVPLIYTAFGEAGTVPLFLIISVHMPIMMTAGTIMTERAARLEDPDHQATSTVHALQAVARNLATNPIVIGVIAGGIWRASGWPLDGSPRIIIDQMSNAAVPCALFSLGMGLKRYGLFGQFPLAIMATTLKLVVMPLIVFLVASKLTNLPPLWVTVVTICAGLPSGVNSYLFAVRFNVGQAGASSAITLTSTLGVVSLIIWLNLLAG